MLSAGDQVAACGLEMNLKDRRTAVWQLVSYFSLRRSWGCVDIADSIRATVWKRGRHDSFQSVFFGDETSR